MSMDFDTRDCDGKEEVQTSEHVEAALMEGLDLLHEETPEVGYSRAQSFSEVGMLTTNNGLVLKLANGHVYQISIVRSK